MAISSKQITGIALMALGIGGIVYLYTGYLKPRLEVDAEAKAGKFPAQMTSAQQPTTPTPTKS